MDISKTVLSPCKDCNDRWINTETLERCHCTCMKYKAYKEKLESNRIRHNNERKIIDALADNRKNWSKNKAIIRQERRDRLKYKTL